MTSSFSIPGTQAQAALDQLGEKIPGAGDATGRIVFAAPEGKTLAEPAVPAGHRQRRRAGQGTARRHRTSSTRRPGGPSHRTSGSPSRRPSSPARSPRSRRRPRPSWQRSPTANQVDGLQIELGGGAVPQAPAIGSTEGTAGRRPSPSSRRRSRGSARWRRRPPGGWPRTGVRATTTSASTTPRAGRRPHGQPSGARHRAAPGRAARGPGAQAARAAALLRGAGSLVRRVRTGPRPRGAGTAVPRPARRPPGRAHAAHRRQRIRQVHPARRAGRPPLPPPRRRPPATCRCTPAGSATCRRTRSSRTRGALRAPGVQHRSRPRCRDVSRISARNRTAAPAGRPPPRRGAQPGPAAPGGAGVRDRRPQGPGAARPARPTTCRSRWPRSSRRHCSGRSARWSWPATTAGCGVGGGPVVAGL